MSMEPVRSDYGIYDEIEVSPTSELFDMDENKCYGNVGTAASKIKNGRRKCRNVVFFLIIVFALLLATAGGCVALTREIIQLKSHIASLNAQMKSLNDKTLTLNSSTQLLFNVLEGPAGQYSFYPVDSCAALPPSSPSGYYWVRASNGSVAVNVYCDMTRSCGGVTGRWMRVAELDMKNSSHQCPSGLRLRNDTGNRTCIPNSDSATCSLVTFLVNTDYSKVCGRIIGYQYYSTNAFGYRNSSSNFSIDNYYVDGVSLTHGIPRQHIWTFAAASDETDSNPGYKCPCINTNTAANATLPPAYVGNDYFCDTGSSSLFTTKLYINDPLWDGAGCGPLNTCCSFNNPPWFHKQLPQSTTDNIEMRVCRDQEVTNEDIVIETIDVFVQ